MVETQKMQSNPALAPQQDQMNNQAGSQVEHQQPPQQVQKPISQIDKLKLMIIRIGDEQRHNRDDHLSKLKTQFLSPFVLKERTHRHTLTETLISCIHCMPHKVNLYSSLLTFIAVEDFDFASDLVRQIVESLHKALVLEANVFASKNVIRLLGNLMQVGLIGSEAFCQFLLQLVEEFQKMSTAQDGSGLQTHSTDLMLEVIFSALPATAQKLSREQSIDFGTVLESLKTMLKEREKTKVYFDPLRDGQSQVGSDLLCKMWEAYQQNTAKIFNSDNILLSPSKKLFVEIASQVSRIGRQIESLPQVYLAEFKEIQYQHSLQNAAQYSFQRQRLRRYRSPFVLDGLIQGISDKFEATLAVETAFALINTFQESHEMAGSNLLNMYIAEELREALPEVILTAVLSLVVQADKPFIEKPVFYTILINQMVEQSKSIESLKKLKFQMEDAFTKHIFGNIHAFDEVSQQRVCQFLAVLLSQTAGRDLGQTEPLLLKLTEGELQQPQIEFLKNTFAQLCRLCFPKKVWEQLDPKFHQYLPKQDNQAGANQDQGDDPELQIITDALLAKESNEKLLEVIQNGPVFVHAILNRTRKSLEHLKTSVERYHKVFETLFQGVDGQKEIVQQVVTVFGQTDRDKSEKVLQKLCQINCISNRAVVEWACESIEKKTQTESWADFQLEFDAILQALQRESTQKWLTVTLYQQKPPLIEEEVQDQKPDGEEGQNMKMETEEVNQENHANRSEIGFSARKRLSMQEYEDQFNRRVAQEIQTFETAMQKLDKSAEKTDFMLRYILYVFRSVETSFITPKDGQQCVCQTIALQSDKLRPLVRLL